MFNFIRYCFEALAVGRFPEEACASMIWDEARASLAGLLMTLRACCLHVKLDWLEATSTFGFPSCSSKLHPCYLCFCERASMHLGLGEREMPFEAMTMSAYDDACRAAEVVVVLVDWL